jgi:hypothetical protein
VNTHPHRAEAWAQVGLLLGVGSVAACASWSHVVSLASRHGQPGWLAFADAAVLETLAVSMGLEVRRRRRRDEPLAFAAMVLVTAVALQLAAQVAQAPRSFWGWTMAALPAIGFLVLAKTSITRSDGGHDPIAVSATQEPRLLPPAPTTAMPTSRPPDNVLRVAARAVANDLARQNVALTRSSLSAGLRARGHRVGTDRATALLANVREELGHQATATLCVAAVEAVQP